MCCESFGAGIAKGLIYLQNTNSKIENQKIVWSKVPKWYYVGLVGSALFITLAVLKILGTFPTSSPSSPYISGAFLALCGGGLFVTSTVMMVKRYLRLRLYEKRVQAGIAELTQEISEQKLTFKSYNKTVPFPPEIIQFIFSFLSVKETVAASKVCKEWNMQTKTDGIWNALGKKKFENWEEIKSQNPNWTPKQLYVFASKIKPLKVKILRETLDAWKYDKLSLG